MKNDLILPDGTFSLLSAEAEAYCEKVETASIQVLDEYYPVSKEVVTQMYKDFLETAQDAKGSNFLTVDVAHNASIDRLIVTTIWCKDPMAPLVQDNLNIQSGELPTPEELLFKVLTGCGS